MRVGILSAMEEEIATLISAMRKDRTIEVGMRTYHFGYLFDVPCTLVFSRWGKVAAASTATSLIDRFGVGEVVFTGVAGAIAPGLKPGDVVIGTSLIQHDLDARPFFKRHEIPLLERTGLPADPGRVESLARAANFVLSPMQISKMLPEEIRKEFKIQAPQVELGEIVSGDRFFSDKAAVHELHSRLPGALCVEMEGAAVAQVCHEMGVPFSILRTISDAADEEAHLDFPKFVKTVASRYSMAILERYLREKAS
ncbi:MAG: 5'-methylthioadenosine/adenosylhomocysteine nucleosidase [Bdellovibrionota bacterium]